MWKKIETYIDIHKKDLDQIEAPNPALWDKIEEQLDAPEAETRPIWVHMLPYMKTAAVIFVCIGIAIWVLPKIGMNGTKADFPKSFVSWPHQQAKYDSIIQELQTKIRKYDPDTQTFMGPYMEDVASLDRTLTELEELKKKNGKSERLIHQLSSTYQEKINLLEELLTELQASNL